MLARVPQARLAGIGLIACLCCHQASAQWTAVRLQASEMYSSQVWAGAGSRQGGYGILGNQSRPILWNSSAASWSDVMPPGFSGGEILAMSGNRQGGNVATEMSGHAALWSGTAASFVDLYPATNPYNSAVVGMDALQQVGYTVSSSADPYQKAALWHGSAASYMSLHPAGRLDSLATSCAAGLQGGYYRATSNSAYHAALWSGTALSMIDLNPPGVSESQILGMAPGQQVGWMGLVNHAAMWHGTAASVIDMNPPGAVGSQITATCGSAQAGWGSGGSLGGIRAGVWFGTPESFFSLSSFTPTGYGQSVATSISQESGLFYVGGYARNLSTNRNEAFVWIGVPAPGTVAAFGAAGVVSMRRPCR